MASVLGFLHRNWLLARPPTVTKNTGALKFGIIGTANIAPLALINPSKSHPDVIIYAIAARDKSRAIAFAKQHRIPVVKDSYDDLLEDIAVDVVYIPLPVSLHCEWALRALSKGKHVLLEKPSTTNAAEAERLFCSELLLPTPERPAPPVLMEAFHNRFSPAWACFMSYVDHPTVFHVSVRAYVPGFLVPDNDIRFNYDLGGGAMLDLGTYAIAALRSVFGTEPEECEECEMDRMPAPLDRCDHSFRARFRFPKGLGEIEGGLHGKCFSWPTIVVSHRPVVIKDGYNTTEKRRRVSLVNFLLSAIFHSIEIEDEFTTTNSITGQVEKRSVKETRKAYTFREMGSAHNGEIYWHTYRHMLEQFCRCVRGLESTAEVSRGEDSVAQMKAVDMAYEKSGLGVRPTTRFELDI